MKEATSRIKINKLLEAAGWRFFADGKMLAIIQLEPSVTIKTADLDALGNDFEKTSKGFIDFLLLDSRGFPFIVLETLHNIGVDQYSFGEVRQALKSYEAALPLWQIARDQLGEGATLSTIGLVYWILGDYQTSQEYEMRALHKAEGVKDYGWQAHITHDLAMARLGIGNPEGALAQFQRALEISKKSDERWFDNHVLHHIREFTWYFGNTISLERTLRKALAKSMKMFWARLLLDARGNKTEALDHFRRAGSLRKTASYRLGEAQCDERIGEVQFSMTRYTEARDSLHGSSAMT